MKLRHGYLLVLLSLIGCSSYKQLQPKPILSPSESGYIELKNGKKNFDIKKDKKYFIAFPSAQENNFYLVFNLPQKKQYNSFLTAQLTDKKKYGEKIAEDFKADTLSVYPIAKNGSGYYLLIDGVTADMSLDIDYRYAPQWRYKFETKYSSFKETLAANKVDRSAYKSIGSGSHLDGMNFPKEIESVIGHTAELDKVYKELLAIESIFPSSILNSKDEAYENYKSLKATIEEEMEFQTNYFAVLKFFGKEFACRGNPAELVKSVDEFIGFFDKKEKFPSTIVSEAQTVLGGRLNEVTPFYDQRLSGKDDAKPFDPQLYLTEQLYKIGNLYQTAGLPTPAEYSTLSKFVKEFDFKSAAALAQKDSLKAIKDLIQKQTQMPTDDFYKEIVKKTSQAKSNVPQQLDQNLGKYLTYRCATNLNTEIAAVTGDFEKSLGQYQEAEGIVVELNVLKAQKDYSSMLGILKQKTHLDFLIKNYRPLDKMSIEEQGNNIESALNNQDWPGSEQLLRKLNEDVNFLNPAEILATKNAIVDELEDSLYTKIDRVSRARINKFLEESIGVLDNIDSLYEDPVFLPAYDVTFSSGSKKELLQKKAELVADLAKTKEYDFPAKAITLLYEKFTSQPSDNGVYKARAVVAHGKHYKGDDKKIKQRISECDPWTSKWITKPADYRRVFALPVTDRTRGKNKYVVRLNVDIPTEAAFPVYDVNIKLPKEVAENAATEQWYEAISLNKILLKNEGRFSITAPSAANEYECQITPVQMNKGKGNILEITFQHNSFKVLPISVMVQKPIIKKN